MSDEKKTITKATAKKSLKMTHENINSFTEGNVYNVMRSVDYPDEITVINQQGQTHTLSREPNGWLEHFDIT